MDDLHSNHSQIDDPAMTDPTLAEKGAPRRAGLAEAPPPYQPAFDAGPVRSYGVGRIAGYLRELLETDPLVGDLWVAGEVTNLSRSQAGHRYFTLSDGEGALRCVFFRREGLGVQFEQGEQVLAHGRISLYEERGDLQFYVDALQPEGVGVLHAELQRLLLQLEGEGLFDAARKRPLPRYPRAIGVATSPAGAVWHDIQSVLGRRWPMTEVLLAPSRVQGEGAAATIVQAIADLNQAADDGEAALDLIIVARGGGSIEDLWPFNNEALARAIFASGLPVVSAVGHETDFTVADYVADARAPTPSAAAEIVVPDAAAERERLRMVQSKLALGLERALEASREELDDLRARLDDALPQVEPLRRELAELQRRARDYAVQALVPLGGTLATLRARLAALDPAATLTRGYAIVLDEAGRPILRAASLQADQRVRLRFQDGEAAARIVKSPASGDRAAESG